MIVSIVGCSCYVYRESGDPVFRSNRSDKNSSWSPPGWYAAESRLLYGVQTILNKRGYGLLKKRMWQDGHMCGGDETQYIRSRDLKKQPSLYVYHANAAIEISAESYNVLGRARLDVVYGAGQENDPNFEKDCREWVASTEAAHPCYQVSWQGEVIIDGYPTVRRLYKGFTALEQARTFEETDPGEYVRLIDRRTRKEFQVHESV